MKLIDTKRFSKRFSKRFMIYFFSYFIMMIILLSIISAIVYSIFAETVDQEMRSISYASLNKTKDTLDNLFYELNRISYQIESEPSSRYVMLKKDSYNEKEMMEDLNKYLSTNEFLQDIGISYMEDDHGLIYSSKGSFSLEYFFSKIYAFDSFTGEDYVNTINDSNNEPVLFPAKAARASGAGSMNLAVYVQTLPYKSSIKKISFIYLLDGNKINKLLINTMPGYSSMVCLYDNEAPMFFASDDTDNSYEEFLNIYECNQTDAINTITMNDEKFVLLTAYSANSKYKYVMIIPEYNYMARLYQLKSKFILIIGGIFILGLSVSLIFSLYNYMPLKKIINLIGNNKINYDTKKDEYLIIKDVISYYAAEYKLLNNSVMYMSLVMKNRLINMLINGNIKTQAELIKLKNILDVRMEEEFHTVVLMKTEQSNAITDYDGNQLSYAISSYVVDNTDQKCQAYVAKRADGLFALLLNYRKQFPTLKVKDLLADIQGYLRSVYHLQTTCGVSDSYSDVFDSHLHYKQAKKALEYQFISGKGEIIHYEIVQKAGDATIWNESDFVWAVTKAINQGSYSDLEDRIKTEIESIKINLISVDAAQYILLKIIFAIHDISEGIKAPDPKRGIFGLRGIIIGDYETIDSFEEEILNYLKELCEFVRTRKCDKDSVIVDQVLDFIKEEYANPQISIHYIADHFQLSSSHLSRFIKIYTGKTLKNHIDLIRMERAEALLKNTNMHVQDIVEMIGECDTTNFIRKFRRKNGVTPVQYRTIVK